MTDAFVRALEEIWTSLPTELGSAWRDLESGLTTLLDEYRNAATEAARARFAQQIEGLILQRAPALWVRLDRAAHATDSGARRPTRGSGDGTLGWPTTLGDPPPSVNPGDLLTVRGADDGRVTRYTDISCPRFVSLQTPRVHVLVRLSELPNRDSAALETLRPLRNKRVQVLLEAPGFEVLNRAPQELDPGNAADSVIFDLRPLRTCTTYVRVTFLQAGSLLGQANAPVEIVEREVPLDDATWPGASLTVGDDGPRPDWLLLVDSDDTATARRLRYRLIGHDGVPRDFMRAECPRSLDDEIRRTYEHLSFLAVHRDPFYRNPEAAAPSMPAAEVERRTRALGQLLWRVLVPRDLKDFYARARLEYGWDARPPSLLIISDSADIPWELVWPTFPDGSSDVPWCERFRLARWLTKADLDPRLSAPPARLALGTFARVIPADIRDDHIDKERTFLADLVGQRGLRDAGPAHASWQALTEWLERDGQDAGCDWLHLTAHGGFAPDTPTLDSSLALEGGGRFRPPDITGEVERTVRRRRTGWLFNSCQAGRCADGLSHTAGWAGRLIEAGAGVFLAPAWALTMVTAAKFTQAFYPRLLMGESLAGAVREARLAARQAGDPSWLAYRLYGHPEARVAPAAAAVATRVS